MKKNYLHLRFLSQSPSFLLVSSVHLFKNSSTLTGLPIWLHCSTMSGKCLDIFGADNCSQILHGTTVIHVVHILKSFSEKHLISFSHFPDSIVCWTDVSNLSSRMRMSGRFSSVLTLGTALRCLRMLATEPVCPLRRVFISEMKGHWVASPSWSWSTLTNSDMLNSSHAFMSCSRHRNIASCWSSSSSVLGLPVNSSVAWYTLPK